MKKNNRAICAFVLLFSCVCSLLFSCKSLDSNMNLSANALADMPNDVDRAKIIIENTNLVTTNKIYESGEYSINAWAFSILLKDAKQNGNANWVDVLKEAKYEEGRIYALIGLYWTDRRTYDAIPKGFRWGYFNFLSCCIQEKESYKELLDKNIHSEEWLAGLVIFPIPDFSELNFHHLIRYSE